MTRPPLVPAMLAAHADRMRPSWLTRECRKPGTGEAVVAAFALFVVAACLYLSVAAGRMG